MSAKRTAYALHSWTGLLAGWLLFVICLTGTLVVYKFPLKALANPQLAASAPVDRLGPDKALARFEAAARDMRVRVVAFPSDAYSIHQYSIIAETPAGKEKRYWINPETGAVRDSLESDFADFIQRLHAGLFMGRIGRWIVGALGVAMVVSIVAGLVFHWPRLRRDAFHLRLGAHRRKAWSDLHKMGGVWALAFHLVIALTGAWLGLEGLVGIRASAASPIELAGEGPGQPLPIAQIVQRAQALRPDFTPTHVNFTHRGAAGSTIRVQGDLPGPRLVQRGQTMLVFDADTGRHLQTVDRTAQGGGRRLLAMMRPLHYGYFWPGVGELLYFLLGGVSTLLAASGLFIWAERERRKRHPKDPDAVIGMERANAGIMGGLIVALTAMALLHGLARLSPGFSAIGAFRFLGSQDVFSSRAMAPELPVFLGFWALAACLLAGCSPLRAWRHVLVATTAALLGLVALTSAGARGTMLTGAAAGYGAACLLLALACFLTIRRLRQPGAARPTSSTQ
ncbi:MAG TPA: PepSY-associated TM helix domain-containing protein [Sphingobium sp.]|nr:PepSY-associated TM helix domain-containing protein [Sphingobium sp.]